MVKNSDKLTVIFFCAVIAALSAAFLFMPSRAFSERENRALAQAPELTADSLLNGGFADGVNLWFADQFPLRDGFVTVKSGFELLLAKQANNGVLYGSDQLAVNRFDAYYSRLYGLKDTDGFFADSVKAQAERFGSVAGKLSVPVITLIPPRTIDVAGDDFGLNGHGDDLFGLIESCIGENAGYIDLLAPLREEYYGGGYVMYRTDHHWTTEGAYLAYLKVAEKLGCEPLGRAEKVETVGDFRGTTASRANFPFCPTDEIELWLYGDEEDYKVVADGKDIGGFYDKSFAVKSDKYSVFLGGTHAETVVTRSDGTEREKLLIVKDSFANCLIPFLARDFDIIATDVKSGYDLTSLTAEYAPKAVIIVCNAENVVSAGELGKFH